DAQDRRPGVGGQRRPGRGIDAAHDGDTTDREWEVRWDDVLDATHEAEALELGGAGRQRDLAEVQFDPAQDGHHVVPTRGSPGAATRVASEEGEVELMLAALGIANRWAVRRGGGGRLLRRGGRQVGQER